LGRNGKTTLLETIRYILGPYSFKANSELVLKKGRPTGPGTPDSETLALRHKRFVYCAETEEGRRLDGNRVKHLCGNDCLTARGLYEKRPTEFLPTHTLYLMTNDKPQIRSDDFAIWQRIKPVPFLVSFVDDPKGDWQKPVDKGMLKKLKDEASGILTWLVDGCLLYQNEGLETPAIVTREAQEYRSAESLLQQWADEVCIIRQYAEAGSKELFDSFTKWLTDNGHQPWSHTTFSNRVIKEFKEYGIDKIRRAEGICFINIGFKDM
jgi:putative DNA primase/helicase